MNKIRTIFLLVSFCFYVGTINAQGNSSKDKTSIFTGVPDSLPCFNGGKPAWIKFLEKNLNAGIPAEKGAPEGTYIPEVSFIVNEDGAISDIKIIKKVKYGTTEELIRLMKISPNWQPAIVNSKPVRYRTTQTITFKVYVE